MKNLLFVVVCVALVAFSFWAFHLGGEYVFLAMMVITVALLISKLGKAKFGGK